MPSLPMPAIAAVALSSQGAAGGDIGGRPLILEESDDLPALFRGSPLTGRDQLARPRVGVGLIRQTPEHVPRDAAIGSLLVAPDERLHVKEADSPRDAE